MVLLVLLVATAARCALSFPLPRRILAFGDSLTAGLVGGVRPDRYTPYGNTLAARLGETEVVSRGVVLESVHSMPARLARTLDDDGVFECALLLGGSNDLWRGESDKIWMSLQALYAQARSHGCSSIGLITLPRFEPSVMTSRWLRWTGALDITERTRRAVNARIRDAAHRDRDCFLVDLAALSEYEEGEAAVMARPDGLHFKEAGYQRLGEAAASALLALLNTGSVGDEPL